jgi:hypothetical protein
MSFAVPGYVEIARDKGVTVLQREGAASIDFVAEGDIAAPPESVRALLLDYARHTQFVHGVAESNVLARSPSELVVYQRLALPVISDRDVTLLVSWGADGATLWTRFTAANHRGPPPRDGVVRMPLDEGGWLLTPIDGGRATRARYSLRLDLAGSLPRFLGRGRAGADLPNLFEAFRRQLRLASNRAP